MTLEAFAPSAPLTLGVELELQLVNTHDYDLAPYAADMLRLMQRHDLPGTVVPEMTRSMIEISTGICHNAAEVQAQLTPIRDALVAGFDRYVTERTSVPCRIAEDPISCVALGTGRVLDDLKKYNAAIYDYRRGEYYDG